MTRRGQKNAMLLSSLPMLFRGRSQALQHLALLHSGVLTLAKSAACPQVRSPLDPQCSELDQRDPWRPVHRLPEHDSLNFCVMTPTARRQTDLSNDVRGRAPDTAVRTSGRPRFSTCYSKDCMGRLPFRPWPLAQDEKHVPDHGRDKRRKWNRGVDAQGFAERLHCRAQTDGRACEMSGPTALQTEGRN